MEGLGGRRNGGLVGSGEDEYSTGGSWVSLLFSRK